MAAAPEKFPLPPLPWAQNALEPYTSANTISFHYGKHHAGYVTKLNQALQSVEVKDMTLEKVIVEAHKGTMKGVYNNAAQTWNHTFFWNSMAPKGGGKPADGRPIAAKINADFGGYDKFRAAFTDAATTQFGSGWAWLVVEGGKLKIKATSNADTPVTMPDCTALLTLDVWEHAYYLDYQNRRPDFINVFLDHLVNWDFADANLAKAGKI
jgi:Fe-Mn family superoxide dismutase